MIYEFHAVGNMGFDGVDVKDGALVATVATEFALDNVMSAIRMQKVTVTKSESAKAKVPPAPPEPAANETTTTGQAPPGGKTRKTK